MSSGPLQYYLCMWRSICTMLYADDAGIVSKSTEGLCEDDDCHCDRCRISRSHRAPNENGGYSLV